MWVTFICSNCYIQFFKMHFECLVKRYCSQTFSPTLQTGFNIPVYNFFFKLPSKIHFVRVAQNMKEYTSKIDSLLPKKRTNMRQNEQYKLKKHIYMKSIWGIPFQIRFIPGAQNSMRNVGSNFPHSFKWIQMMASAISIDFLHGDTNVFKIKIMVWYKKNIE